MDTRMGLGLHITPIYYDLAIRFLGDVAKKVGRSANFACLHSPQVIVMSFTVYFVNRLLHMYVGPRPKALVLRLGEGGWKPRRPWRNSPLAFCLARSAREQNFYAGGTGGKTWHGVPELASPACWMALRCTSK